MAHRARTRTRGRRSRRRTTCCWRAARTTGALAGVRWTATSRWTARRAALRGAPVARARPAGAFRRSGLAALLRARRRRALRAGAIERRGDCRVRGQAATAQRSCSSSRDGAVDPDDDRDTVVRLAYAARGVRDRRRTCSRTRSPTSGDTAALGVHAGAAAAARGGAPGRRGGARRDPARPGRDRFFWRHYQAVHAREVSQSELAPIRENAPARLAAFPGEQRVPDPDPAGAGGGRGVRAGAPGAR